MGAVDEKRISLLTWMVGAILTTVVGFGGLSVPWAFSVERSLAEMAAQMQTKADVTAGRPQWLMDRLSLLEARLTRLEDRRL